MVSYLHQIRVQRYRMNFILLEFFFNEARNFPGNHCDIIISVIYINILMTQIFKMTQDVVKLRVQKL